MSELSRDSDLPHRDRDGKVLRPSYNKGTGSRAIFGPTNVVSVTHIFLTFFLEDLQVSPYRETLGFPLKLLFLFT